jgi:peptidoglycan/LPS O-acetylase OafA/YrhL
LPATETEAVAPPAVRYWPALDGVRAIAVLLVLAYHLELPYSPRGGSIGVTMFFALSGFLITSLLLAERERAGTISLGRFYARRAMRLLPALVVVVAVVAAYAQVTDRGDDTVSAAPAVLLYTANWVRATDGFLTLGLFEHLWSLSVEEQFYVLWPVMVIAAAAVGARRRAEAVLAIAAVGCVASLVLRLRFWDGADPAGSAARLYNGIDTVADQLLVGCAFAALLHLLERAPDARGLEALRRFLAVLAPIALAFLVWVAAFRPGGSSVDNNRLYLIWGAPVFAAAAVAVVGDGVLSPRGRLATVLSIPPLVGLGKISYGLYLWHYPVIVVLGERMADEPSWVRWSTSTIASLAVALVSWHVVERPWLRRKPRPAASVG